MPSDDLSIDRSRCTGCGRCVGVCPDDTLSVVDGKAQVVGTRCMECGHCAAACPEEAIRLDVLDQDTLAFESFETTDRWLPHGGFDTAELARLMRSRRSCRSFTPDPVDPRVLRDLVKVGITAPSGTNSQRWTFTLLPDRAAMLHLGQHIARFFEATNRKAESPILRWGLAALGRPELGGYYRDYYPAVCEALREWRECGRDRLFHGATAGILVGARPGASCPMEDAMLATQNILLASHAMGLGSCLIGYAVAAMSNDPSIGRAVGIPAEESVYSAIALGHPAERYRRAAGRKKPLVRFSRPD